MPIPISNPSRNPNNNWEIDPNRNWQINPTRNWQINPARIWQIDPKRNWQIDPTRNWQINPARNWQINPARNWQINPYRNWQLNPKRNWQLDPSKNPNFSGLYLFNTKGVCEYFVVHIDNATNRFLLIFNEVNELTAFCVSQGNTFIVYNLKNIYMGIITSNGKGGYNRFDTQNVWIGYLV